MKDRATVDEYHDLPCGSALFPEYARLFRKLSRLKKHGFFTRYDGVGTIPNITIGDILDKHDLLLGHLEGQDVIELRQLRQKIESNPEALQDWSKRFDRKRAVKDKSEAPVAASILSEYRDLPCGVALFPKFARLFRKIGTLQGHGLLKGGNDLGTTSRITIGDILDMDAKVFGRLPGVGKVYVHYLYNLRDHISSNPEVLADWRKNLQKQENVSDLESLLQTSPYAFSNYSLNYQFLDKAEVSLLHKRRNSISDNFVQDTVFWQTSEIGNRWMLGGAAVKSLTTLREKVIGELTAIAQDEKKPAEAQNGLLRLSEYFDVDLATIDQPLLDDVETYLFSLDEMHQNIALARWGFHRKKETLQELGARYDLSRERIRQMASDIDNMLPNFIRIDPIVLKQNIRENLTSSLTETLSALAACFGNTRHFYSFIELLCNTAKNSIYSIAHPVVSKRMLDAYFCRNASPIPHRDLMEELTSDFGYSSTLAHNTIRELEAAGRLRITEHGIYPSNLGRNEAVAHILAGHVAGLPWKDAARIVNKSGCCATEMNEHRLTDAFHKFDQTYQCGRGTYRNLRFFDLSQYDVESIIKRIIDYIHASNASSLHLNDYYYQADTETKKIDYFDLRHLVRTFGEDYGLYFTGKSGADTIGLKPNFDRITQSKLIVEIMTRSKVALTIPEIAARLMSKSIGHASFYVDRLQNSGEVVRVDNLMYTTAERAFHNIDTDSILCMIDDILIGSGKPVECDIFRLRINRQLNLSFPKYFYASLAFLNIDEFAWQRSGNLFSIDELDLRSMKAYVEAYCDPQQSNAENLDRLRQYVEVTGQAGLRAIDAWRSSKP